MAKYEIIEYEGRKVRRYESGLLMGMDGRIIKPAEHTLIDSSGASVLHGRKLEKKRAAVMTAANDAIEGGKYGKFQDLAFVAAIAESAMRKAMNPRDAKSIEAARFLLSESGLSEGMQGSDESPGRETISPRVLVILAEYARRQAESDEVLEGSIHG